jgi:hypothetical protein
MFALIFVAHILVLALGFWIGWTVRGVKSEPIISEYELYKKMLNSKNEPPEVGKK